MSPRLDAILRDAAGDDPPSRAQTMARLVKAGYTPDAVALEEAVNALHDEADLRDGLIDPYTFLDCPPPRPCVDRLQEALEAVATEYDAACMALAARSQAVAV